MNLKKVLRILDMLSISYPQDVSYEGIKEVSRVSEHEFLAMIEYLRKLEYVKIWYNDKPRFPSTIEITPNGIDFLRKEERNSENRAYKFSNYILTIILVTATILQSVIAYQSYLSEQEIAGPILIGPEFVCPQNFTENTTTVFEYSFKNFGKKMTSEIISWYGNNTEGFTDYFDEETKKGFRESIQVPIIYPSGEEITIKIIMRIKNSNLTYSSFYITYRENSLLTIPKTSGTCNYKKENITQNYILTN
jgi:hypothetical protein